MSKIRVLIIDNIMSAITLSSNLFSGNKYFEVISTISTQEDFEKKCVNLNPDLIFVDPEYNKISMDDILAYSNKKNSRIVLFSSKLTYNEEIPFIEKPTNIMSVNKSNSVGIQIIDQLMSIFNIKPKIKVMVVDDAVLMRMVIYKLFESDSNFEVVGKASNGKEAINEMEKSNPDVILLDIEMPVMDGLEFLKIVRLKSNAKIVILSSLAQKGSEKSLKARSLGADAIIMKPSGAVSTDLVEKSGKYIIDTIYQLLNSNRTLISNFAK